MLIYRGINRIYSHDNIEKLKHLIENDYDESTANSSNTNFSYKLDKYLISSGVADILDIGNCCITIMIIIFYITSTYTTSNMGDNSLINDTINTIEIFLCIFLLAHYCLKLYVAQYRLYFFLSFDSLTDIGTLTPILLVKQDYFSRGPMSYYFRLL